MYIKDTQWIVIDLDLASPIGEPPTWDNGALHRDTMHEYQPVHDLYQLALMVQQVEGIWCNEPKDPHLRNGKIICMRFKDPIEE
ncbi:hypothetical protein PROFUN_14845 [Planoprotostelium fungivorum]|uniref:Uncharacterized protein n=1 Tax=Planoprotostelium fungivorum TaxID=1890364 RepID=A0A2P6MYK9_9EUKA|nr:hypothetical protein PROFUN_14845 [Planoprotostelium fungivorum]